MSRSFLVSSFALSFLIACAAGCSTQPDVVLRPGTQFTKASTLSLSVASDFAIFRPELEKELIRRGFNIVTDDVSQIVSKETKVANQDVAAAGAGAKSDSRVASAAAAAATGAEVRESQTSKVVKSEFVGRVDYLYSQDKHAVRRVNFTIYELRSGSVVASIGYDAKETNQQVARAIALYLDAAVSGVPVKKSRW